MNYPLNYREISDPAVMSVQPLVSVFMLAYRHENFLAQAIEGVVNQVCSFPFELIVAEDCSPDRTLSIALDYQRRYPHIIRVITGDKNVGMHANADRSLTTIRGKYVASCEGDDYWHHMHKLQMQVDAMETAGDATLCHTEYDREMRSGIKKNCHQAEGSPYLANGYAYESLLHRWTVTTATTLFRTDIVNAFKQSPLCDKKWPFGDYNQALFAAANGRIIYLTTSTTTWRKVAGSATNANVGAYLNMAVSYAECRDRFMAKYPVPAHVELSVRTASKLEIMKRAFWAGRPDLFDECNQWLKSHQLGPHPLPTLLKRFILSSSLLIGWSQSFRTLVRQFRLVRR